MQIQYTVLKHGIFQNTGISHGSAATPQLQTIEEATIMQIQNSRWEEWREIDSVDRTASYNSVSTSKCQIDNSSNERDGSSGVKHRGPGVKCLQ